MEGAPMLDTTTFIGLDVHARSIKAVSLDVMTGEVRCATFGYDAGAVAEWVRSVDPKARCVYESGVTGFDLQKRPQVPFLRAPRAPHACTDCRFDVEASAAATDCPARDRRGRILNCKDERR